MFLGDNLVS
jgi:hypothetical protein